MSLAVQAAPSRFFLPFPSPLSNRVFPMSDISSKKNQLRKKFRGRRKRVHEESGAAAASLLAENFIAAGDDMGFPDSGVIAVYDAMGSEIDAMPLSLALQNCGYDLALPVVASVRAPLIFRQWKPGDDLIDGPHATRHPGPGAPVATPDVVLVPLVAFDRMGGRLGQGQGYYDRTIAFLRGRGNVLAVGLAFAVQEADGLPHGDFDEPLDWLVTEKEVIRCGED